MWNALRRPAWIAFDVYATLINREEGGAKAFREILEKNSAGHLNPTEMLNEWHHAVVRAYRTRFITWKEAGRNAMGELSRRHQVNLPANDAEILYQSMAGWPTQPDVVPVLSELRKQHKIAVVTNMDTDLFERTKIGVPLDAAITSEMAKAYKPHPAIFEHALRTFGCAREEVLWVGTTPWADVVGARLAGLTVVWIKRQMRNSVGPLQIAPWEPLPDYEFDDLYGLQKLLSETR